MSHIENDYSELLSPIPVQEKQTDRILVIKQIIMVSRPPELGDILPIVLYVIVYAIIVQILFTIWKRISLRSFDIFIFALIFLTQFVVIYLINSFYFLIAISLVFNAYLIYLIKLAFSFNSNMNTPQIIYKSFKNVFSVTNMAIFISQGLLVYSFFRLPEFVINSLFFMIYSIYNALLSREVIRNLSIVMAENTGFYSKDGVPGRTDTDSKCMICTKEIDTGKTITLRCGHRYHEDCIMGYCIIGNNKCCQFCKQGIDNQVFDQTYWLRSESKVRPMMNAMRSSIGFFGTMLIVYLYKQKNTSSDSVS